MRIDAVLPSASKSLASQVSAATTAPNSYRGVGRPAVTSSATASCYTHAPETPPYRPVDHAKSEFASKCVSVLAWLDGRAAAPRRLELSPGRKPWGSRCDQQRVSPFQDKSRETFGTQGFRPGLRSSAASRRRAAFQNALRTTPWPTPEAIRTGGAAGFTEQMPVAAEDADGNGPGVPIDAGIKKSVRLGAETHADLWNTWAGPEPAAWSAQDTRA